MTQIENIGTIVFSSFKRAEQVSSGYVVREILVFNKRDCRGHSSWLTEAVFEILSKKRVFKKDNESFLFVGWRENEFSFYQDDLDEVLAFLNNVVFS